MLTHSFAIEMVPTLTAGGQGDTAVRLRFGDLDVTCTVRPMTGQQENAPGRQAAVLADVLRPGWQASAMPLGVPIVKDGILYRGFRMVRASRIDGREWEIVVVAPTALGEAFDWRDLEARMNEAHRTIFNGNAND